jgi:hypothetical protein
MTARFQLVDLAFGGEAAQAKRWEKYLLRLTLVALLCVQIDTVWKDAIVGVKGLAKAKYWGKTAYHPATDHFQNRIGVLWYKSST